MSFLSQIRILRNLSPLLIPLALLAGYLNAGGWWLRSGVTLSCLALVISVWVLRSRQRDLFSIMLAFAFSIAGDSVLGRYSAQPMGFLAGVILFLLAHLAYIKYCLVHGSPCRPVMWLLMAVFLGYYVFCLLPVVHPWPLSVAVLAYIFISILSLSSAWGMRGQSFGKWLFVVGIAFLLFSDLLISLNTFMGISGFRRMIMPTYFASQIFVTASVLCCEAKGVEA